jgi:branched-chain amino acid transport system ATP-binding protein
VTTSAATVGPDTAATAWEPALTVTGLDAGYGTTKVLRDVSISVPVGEVTALVGPNGAGKSTLLRTISGFLPASRGTVRLFGADVTKKPAHRRFGSGLCLVPEGRGIFRSLTVRENLVLQSPKGGEQTAIERAAEAFPILRERLGQTAGTLSGGQQQMLAMASAYVRSPRLVLVDEASLGLAPLVVDEIFDFLGQLPARGASLLVVDQFVTRALQLATTAYVLRQGEVVYSGGARELLDGELFSHYTGTD